MGRTAAWFLAAVVSAASGCTGSSDGPACSPQAGNPAGVKVFYRPFSAAVRTDLNLLQVRGVSAGMEATNLQGLTVVEHAFERHWSRTVERGRRQGTMCVLLSDLSVDLTPSKATIYVPSEYVEGSCEREEILRHEREHELVHREELEAFARRLRSAVSRADWLPVSGIPLEVPDEAEADRRLHAAFEKVLRPEHEAFLRELGQRNAVLDDPGNYRWVTARCSGWL